MDDTLSRSLEELKQLNAMATPGPWLRNEANVFGPNHNGPDNIVVADCGNSWSQPAIADAALIVAMRNTLPLLLAEIERQRQMSEQRRAILADVAAILFNETRGVPIDSEAASAFADTIQRALSAIPDEAIR